MVKYNINLFSTNRQKNVIPNIISLKVIKLYHWVMNKKQWVCQIQFTMFILCREFLMIEQIFLSLQVKRGVIVSNKLVYTSFLTRC